MYRNLLKTLAVSALLILASCNSNNEPSYIACGGGIDFVCPVNMYCQMDENCGGIDSKGYCLPIPKSCPEEDETICACNNKEYKNLCIANTLGLSLKNNGPCISSPTIEVTN